MENKKLKILIVDDDNDIRNTYVEVFKRENFEVDEAVDGLEGLNKAIKNIPDLIFTGIIMPKMDGFGLMEALQKNVITSGIPVVFSSHLGREVDQQKAQELGAKDFIVTGMSNPREVAARVRAIFFQKEREYKLKIDPIALDAKKIATDTSMPDNLLCQSCGGELIVKIKSTDVKSHSFSAQFECLKCGKTQ